MCGPKRGCGEWWCFFFSSRRRHTRLRRDWSSDVCSSDLELSAFPEVPSMLKALKDGGMQTAILSNGSPDMLKGAVESAGIADLLDDVLSVQDVGVFKPHKFVYDMVGDRFACEKSEVLFVSSNGWDAANASGYGFYTAWVNRAGEPMDRLPWKPQKVMQDLTGIPEVAKEQL